MIFQRSLFSLTLRQLAGRWRTLALLLIALSPVVIAAVYSAFESSGTPEDLRFNVELFENQILAVLLPVIVLILSSSAFGEEIRDGTIVYIVTKPISRLSIVVSKFAGAGTVALLLVGIGVVISAIILMSGTINLKTLGAFILSTSLGVLTYGALFLVIRLLVSRALIVGFAYILLWEGLLGELFTGSAWFSVRAYLEGVERKLIDERFLPDVEVALQISLYEGLAVLVGVTVFTLALATWRLRRMEFS